MSHSTHYRSFRRRFYGSDDPTNSVVALKDRKFDLRIKEHKKEVDSFTAGTQTRAYRAKESSVTHKSAITDHAMEENHVVDWDKAKVVDIEAGTDQMDKSGSSDQEDTDVHES